MNTLIKISDFCSWAFVILSFGSLIWGTYASTSSTVLMAMPVWIGNFVIREMIDEKR